MHLSSVSPDVTTASTALAATSFSSHTLDLEFSLDQPRGAELFSSSHSVCAMSSGIPPPRPGLSTPAKKPAFRPSSVHPSSSPSANSSPVPSQITPPKSKIPTITSNTRSPSNSTPPSPSHTPTSSISSPAALLRSAPNLNKKHADKRLSGEINAARTYLHSEASLSAAAAIQSQVVSQADRRNKLKKRALIQQTEKIKELLWEKASLMQKKQLMEEEQRELDGLKRKVEDEREERQKAWVMEEAMRREEEEEELRYAVMRMRKYAQRYDFEMAKREKMIASKEAKDKKRSNYAAEVAESNRRQQEERSRLADGIRGELDDTLPPDTLLDAPIPATRPPPSLQTSTTTTAGQVEALSPRSAGAVSPGSVTSERSTSSNNNVQPYRRPSESTASTVSDGDVARELHATGFPATQKQQATADNGSAETEKKSGEQDEMMSELNDDTIANADGILDEDDVTFVSSDDESDEEEEKEAESSRRGSRRSSASVKLSKAATRLEREEKEQERERDEREKRAKETQKEREERERREQEDREKKEREWQELKERLMSEARELQEAERQRMQSEREAEQRQLAASMAAKEAEMNELLAKLKEVEAQGVPALPALPDAQPMIGTPEPAAPAPVAETPVADASAGRSVTTPAQSTSNSAATSKSLPPLSSITLRSASESLARRTVAADDDIIDEPTQAPGAQNALPSLSSTPVRRLVAASTTAASTTAQPKKAKAKSEPSESMAISSMLHELEQLEEEEEMMLRMGLEVRKVPRMGKSKVVKMYIDKNEADEWVVRWDSKKKNKDEASILLNGCKVVTGMQAGLFLKPENAERFSAQRNCCFSVITEGRTLDVVAMTFSDQDLWTRTLVRLSKQRKRGTVPNTPSAANTPAESAAGSRIVSPVNSAPASRRSSGNVGGFVSVGTERSRNKQSVGGSEMSAADPSKEIENYLSRHLKNF